MIRITDLDFWYSKKAPLFQNLSLELETGKIHGILGKNGTGKSTLLKLISGSLFPKRGIVKVNDQISAKRKPKTLQEIFSLPEECHVPSITIDAYVNANSSFYPGFSRSKFDRILQNFELPSNGALHKLSLGQKKKSMIAFGIACRTAYLLFDEPTNGLDIPSKSQFRKLIASELEDHQTIVVSTHQVRDLGQILDTVVILDDGKIIFNQDRQSIEQHLLFTKSIHELNEISSLHVEKIMGGQIYVSPNEFQETTEAELEVLFNAISINRKGIVDQFKNP